MKALVGAGEGPGRGLLRDCTTSPINRFAALDISYIYTILHPLTVIPAQDVAVPGELGPGGTVQVHRRAQGGGGGVRPGAGDSQVSIVYC